MHFNYSVNAPHDSLSPEHSSTALRHSPTRPNTQRTPTHDVNTAHGPPTLPAAQSGAKTRSSTPNMLYDTPVNATQQQTARESREANGRRRMKRKWGSVTIKRGNGARKLGEWRRELLNGSRRPRRARTAPARMGTSRKTHTNRNSNANEGEREREENRQLKGIKRRQERETGRDNAAHA
ncbi:hypothetical protein BDN71DRAFT_650541 [Pleurotus eryngii]|uniref:Uncharacterized protein n=1 Tax=Pleurotus eryngii TaxID=5323 RepID=A0A9P5ZJB3_PLEER|nr:hypothetical protein BDN71DRAFT_650541 [Pleurotus eryngii]